jgi:hypothetical protein
MLSAARARSFRFKQLVRDLWDIARQSVNITMPLIDIAKHSARHDDWFVAPAWQGDVCMEDRPQGN